MTTATLVSISFTFNFLTEKSRLRHGSVLVHHFPFKNLNFTNHIDSSLGCFGKCKQRKLKTLGAKDGYNFFENEPVKHGIDIEQFDSLECTRMLQDCVRRKSVREGKQIHAQIIQNQEEANVFLGTGLVNMYAKCGNLVDARQLFDKMPERNIVSWNAMLSGYVQNEYWEDALKLFGSMRDADMMPDQFTLSGLLGICAGMRDPVQGKAVHGMAIKAGFVPSVAMENCLVDMYVKCILLIDAHRVLDKIPERSIGNMNAKCGNLVDARQVFDKMPERNIVSWNLMLTAYIQNGYWEDALNFFGSMRDADMMPNEFILSSLLIVCARMRDPAQGKALHGMAIKAGFVPCEDVENFLVDMYGKCNLLMDARRVFEEVSEPNVTLWNRIIRSYVENKNHEEAIKLFSQLQGSSSRANDITMTSVLKACAQLKDLQIGKQMHGCIIKSLPDLNVWVETSLITVYSKCGGAEYAFKVFERMSKENVVSWNAMFAGCVRNGHCEQALNLFRQMQMEGIRPDEVTFQSVLGACASLAPFDLGKQVHVCIIKGGYESNGSVQNAIDVMYAKLGHNSFKLFEKTPEQNILVNAQH